MVMGMTEEEVVSVTFPPTSDVVVVLTRVVDPPTSVVVVLDSVVDPPTAEVVVVTRVVEEEDTEGDASFCRLRLAMMGIQPYPYHRWWNTSHGFPRGRGFTADDDEHKDGNGVRPVDVETAPRPTKTEIPSTAAAIHGNGNRRLPLLLFGGGAGMMPFLFFFSFVKEPHDKKKECGSTRPFDHRGHPLHEAHQRGPPEGRQVAGQFVPQLAVADGSRAARCA